MAIRESLSTYKPYLFAVAYNVLGEIEEAEDIIQDSFEYMLMLPSGHVHNETAYLTRIEILNVEQCVYLGIRGYKQ